jgi:hypothetical protein
MKNHYKIIPLLVGLFLSISVCLIGCRLPAATTSPGDEKIYIILEPCLKANSGPDGQHQKERAPLITFEELALESGTLDRDYINPAAGGLFPQGEPCFLLKGTIRNGYDEGSWVAYHATGYEDSGNTVSYTLDEGPLTGLAQVYIAGKSAESFTLHMNWSDNVSIIKIRSQKSDVMFP